MDELIDPSKWEAEFPIFALKDESTGAAPLDMIWMNPTGNNPFLPIFTDSDLAERINNLQRRPGRIVAFVDIPSVIALIEHAKKKGLTKVGIDFSLNPVSYMERTVEEFLAMLHP